MADKKNITAVALSENKVFIAYSYCSYNTSDNLYGVVCEVNETNITVRRSTTNK
ncbi:MAG: hypothetical protein HFJ26_10000 [Clostridia bacterium]|nr:hypothetical protein [Clostridia bacterium]